MNIKNYESLIFDCDGVLLNSNFIKTNSFRKVLSNFNEEAIEELISFHKKNGGLSRYKKFQHFIENIAPKYNIDSISNNHLDDLDFLCESFAESVFKDLVKCEVTPDLEKLRNKTINQKWFIVSGGDQNELREVFSKKGLDHFFDGGIYGSPQSKYEILIKLLKEKKITKNGIFFGDSILDYDVSKKFKYDFTFISEWTDLLDWENYCRKNKITYVRFLRDFMNVH